MHVKSLVELTQTIKHMDSAQTASSRLQAKLLDLA
jgi:hypothetical protein